MWTAKYFFSFKDDDGGDWRVELQSQSSVGAPIELEAGEAPLVWQNSGSESQTETIIGATGTILLHITEETLPHLVVGGILPNDVLARRVVATRDGLTVFVGYVQMKTISQDWEATPVDIEIPIMDTVEALSSIFVEQGDTAQNTIELLRHAHALAYGITEEEQPDDWILTNQPQYWGKGGPTTKLWSDAEVFNGFSVSEDGESRKSYEDVIDIILSPHGRLIQIGERWIVAKTRDDSGTMLYKLASKTGTTWVLSEQSQHGSILEDISNAIGGADNTQNVLPSPSKVTYSYTPEEGEQTYNGSTIYQFEKDNIKTHYSETPAVNVEWDKDGVHHLMRYMRIAESNLQQPVTIEYHKMSAVWYNDYIVAYTQLPVFAPDAISSHKWAQPMENENAQGWKVRKAQTHMFYRYLFREEYQPYPPEPDYNFDKWSLISDIFTMKIHREVVTSDVFVAKLTRNIQTSDMVDSADFSDNESRRTYCLQPFTQIYWSPVPWGEGVKPKKVYRYPSFNPPANPAPEWTDCDDFFFPQYCTDTSMLPDKPFTQGFLFHLPGNRGYIAIRIYGSGWPIPNDIMFPNDHNARVNHAGPFVVSEYRLTNESWVGTIPTHLLEWNTKNDTEYHTDYNDGQDEVSVQFKTLADTDPKPETFLTPRRGFDDSMTIEGRPREMIDIEAVQVTTPEGIPGITRFSLFQFNGKTYFPAAVGMNARDNTVSLKLIRTI